MYTYILDLYICAASVKTQIKEEKEVKKGRIVICIAALLVLFVVGGTSAFAGAAVTYQMPASTYTSPVLSDPAGYMTLQGIFGADLFNSWQESIVNSSNTLTRNGFIDVYKNGTLAARVDLPTDMKGISGYSIKMTNPCSWWDTRTQQIYNTSVKDSSGNWLSILAITYKK